MLFLIQRVLFTIEFKILVVKFDKTAMNYEPVIHINDYWNLLRDFQPINETVKEVGFHVTYQVQMML